MHNFKFKFPVYPAGHIITQRLVVESANVPIGHSLEQIFYC